MRSAVSILTTLLALGGPVGVALQAQTLAAPAERPAEGLFNRTGGDGDNLDVSVSLRSGYDDNLLAVGGGPPDPRTQQSGMFDRLASSLSYRKRFQHAEIGLTEGSTVQYYPSVGQLISVDHAAGVGLTLSGEHTHLTLGQTFAYVPMYSVTFALPLFSGDPGGVPPSGSDLATVRRDQQMLGSTASLTQAISKRVSATATAGLQTSEFAIDRASQSIRTIGGRLSWGTSRYLNVIAGYGYQDFRYSTATLAPTLTRIHNIDTGVEYNRALSRTRRTTIGFTTGSTVFANDGRAPDFRLIGEARLNREIGRTWHAAAVYRRGLRTIQGLQEPMFADTVSGNVGGTLNRRLEVSIGGDYSNGEVGQAVVPTRNGSYNGAVQLRIALFRGAVMSAQYVLYHYKFDPSVALPAGVPAEFSRNGLRVGVDLWHALIH